MIDTFRRLMKSQYDATLCMLNTCIDSCPESSWYGPVANWRFCQVAFHVMFFTDLYLEGNEDGFRQQAYHRDNADVFCDYEELRSGPPTLTYDKPTIKNYLAHCRMKAQRVMDEETEETLRDTSRFDWLTASRAEVHLYNIRHIQHHAAQLALRLRLDAAIDVPWVKTGWMEA